MVHFENETKQNIRSYYDEMTPVEKNIANFFLNNTEKCDLSSKNIAKCLYVSEASLSRFAKKCGYKGYRELSFSYEKDLEFEKSGIPINKDVNHFAKKVYGYYQNLLRDNCERVDEVQMGRIVKLLDGSRRVIVYGVGSSGIAAKEIQFRFMRLGLNIEVITDSHMIKMSSVLVDDNSLVIGISLSGQTKEVVDGLCDAKKNKAKVILVTSNLEPAIAEYCDEILQVTDLKNLDYGNKISPQFPILVVFDILYAYYMDKDSSRKTQKHKDTVSAVRTI